MYKITNINTLGAEYSVTDQNGNFLKKIQIVSHNNILDAALGKYTDEFTGMKDYLEKSVAVLSGFENIDPHKVSWYVSDNEGVLASEVVTYAITNGYEKIILEYIKPED